MDSKKTHEQGLCKGFTEKRDTRGRAKWNFFEWMKCIPNRTFTLAVKEVKRRKKQEASKVGDRYRDREKWDEDRDGWK